MEYTVLLEKGNYTLLSMEGKYVVVHGLDKEKHSWDWAVSDYLHYSGDDQAAVLAKAMEIFRLSTEENYTSRLHLEEIATKCLSRMIEDEKDEAYFEEEVYDFLYNECGFTESDEKFFEVETMIREAKGEDEEDDEYFDDSEAWEDDSDRGCRDCPVDECTGHCMSCYYRPV